jgi:mannobiose 2-epimerase
MKSFFLTLTLLTLAIACSQKTSESGVRSSDFDRMAIAAQMEKSLKTETLDIWYPKCVDEEYGGYLSTWTYDFKPEGDQNKMIVSQARHVWVNAKASKIYPGDAHFRKGALTGFRFLKDKMWDQTHGGFYWLVSRKGEVLDDSKTAYGNAFGIFALAGYYAATSDTAALSLAKKAFLWLENHSHDSIHKGYYQHMKRDGTKVVRDASIDSRAETGYKDQNSSIHLLEAFAELYNVWPDPLLKERLQEMLLLIRDTITHEKGYLVLFFSHDWQPVSFRDSTREVIEKHHGLDHVSFGHDIETAYLMLEATEILGNENDTVTLRAAKKMVDHCLDFGYDNSVGGIFDEGYYFKGSDKLEIIRDTKNWWAQAEGMNTMLIMADLFPDDPRRYEQKFLQQWSYIDKYLIDHQNGDWYAGGLDKEPSLRTALKGHQWKATYHHYRSMANCIRRLKGEVNH